MRGFALFVVLLAETAQSAHGFEQATVAQLEQMLTDSREGDSALTARLLQVQLTQRLLGTGLLRMEQNLRGEKSREALISIADLSSFLDPAADEISALPAPDVDEQRRIVAKVVDYVIGMSHRLPNFFATRSRLRFEDRPMGPAVGDAVAGVHSPSRLVGKSSTGITYREGQEILDNGSSKTRKTEMEPGLNAWGLFGPVLSRVLIEASHGKLEFGHWQRIDGKQLAVFRFTVPMEKSSYAVKFCCMPSAVGFLAPLDRITAYHGEIAVDPDEGTVVRLALLADLDHGDLPTLLEEYSQGMPLSRADILVEYSPVEIGGKSYYCPTRSVTISRARTVLRQNTGRQRKGTLGPEKLFINDETFSDYHVFRSESRILIDSGP
jgi:hypothetical protein